ncbi:hypothetical protein M0657_011954 [Pyricularia oryzae]|nr:hypothetical protein M0657_011954 [Pyricularia oryzae]KAI7911753.1 hypothetical protein M9X92_010381 [Pyricularia oryzae]
MSTATPHGRPASTSSKAGRCTCFTKIPLQCTTQKAMTRGLSPRVGCFRPRKRQMGRRYCFVGSCPWSCAGFEPVSPEGHGRWWREASPRSTLWRVESAPLRWGLSATCEVSCTHMSQGHARVRQRKSHLCECEAGTKCMSTFVLILSEVVWDSQSEPKC